MAVFNITSSPSNTTLTQGVGPLSSLFTDSLQTESLSYPNDLAASVGNATKKPHVVKFFINVPQNSQYVTASGSVTQLSNYGPGSGSQGNSFGGGGLSVSISPVLNRLAGDISLYMPDTMNINYDVSYEGEALTDFTVTKYASLGESFFDKQASGAGGNFNSIVSSAKAIVGTVLENSVPSGTLLKGEGIAINPQLQLIFKAVSLRTFQMDFMFSPKDPTEAATVRQIIQTFKFHAAPELGGDDTSTATGLFFVVPSTFNIMFLFQGQENPYIQRVGECVLESVGVDYAPNGFSTFFDGSPTQTRMTLQFKETQLVDKSQVLQGL